MGGKDNDKKLLLECGGFYKRDQVMRDFLKKGKIIVFPTLITYGFVALPSPWLYSDASAVRDIEGLIPSFDEISYMFNYLYCG